MSVDECTLLDSMSDDASDDECRAVASKSDDERKSVASLSGEERKAWMSARPSARRLRA